MARIPVAELRVQTQGGGLVRVTTHGPAPQREGHAPAPQREGRDLREWAARSNMSSGAMVTTGLGLAALGAIGALVITPGLLGVVVLASLLTGGAGLAFLGVLKRRDGLVEPKALPPASSSAVLAERARRVQAVLDDGNDHTFEQLLATLRWTESALLEALVVMKDSGQIIEDLDLETGEWIYRSQVTAFGTGSALNLEERQARGL